MEVSNKSVFVEGMKDGIPIGLGYFAVAFSLGIMATKAGLTATTGFLTSLLINASAGEYAGFTVMAENAAYVTMIVITVVVNARYLLMSCALSQKFDPKTPFFHRLGVGFYLTDEIFGITVARSGYLNPFYTYGAALIASPMWAAGTGIGIIMGNVLPLRVVSALSVALFGMFLAIIIPPGRKNKVVLGVVLVSFAGSFAFQHLPVVSAMSSGTRTLILTIVIAAAAAVLFPVKEEEEA